MRLELYQTKWEPGETEWMDEAPYPGPEFVSDIELFTHIMVNRGQQINKMYADIANAFGMSVQMFTDLYGRVSEALVDLGKAIAPLSSSHRDQDQPKGIVIHRNHGPYAGSGFDRHGRKRY